MRSFCISDKDKFPTTIGVYSITFFNSKSNKFYIGSASNSKKGCGFKSRWKNHISDLKLKKHDSKKLQNACNKYGIENIIFSILIECLKDECLVEEQKFIVQYDSFNNGYNSRPVANNQLGFKHSDESKQKIKKANEDRNKSLKEQYKQDVLELYKSNKSIREIKKLLPIKRKLITDILKENKVVMKNKADYVRIPIYQYDINGLFLKQWGSAYECANNTKFSEKDIRRSCSKVSITKGCIFYKEFKEPETIRKEIEESYKNMKIKHSESSKKLFTKEKREFLSRINLGNNNRGRIENIGQYDLDGNLLKIWRNSVEIVEFYKLINSSPITRVLRGDRTSFRGFMWKIVDKDNQ
jgi:group I intron endonuclease